MLSKSEILITKRFLFSKKTEGYVSIFSWFSILGIALGVAANSYVGAGSITINSLVKPDLARFQAILEPMIPPPIIAILLTKLLCQLWYERRGKYSSRNAKN